MLGSPNKTVSFSALSSRVRTSSRSRDVKRRHRLPRGNAITHPDTRDAWANQGQPRGDIATGGQKSVRRIFAIKPDLDRVAGHTRHGRVDHPCLALHLVAHQRGGLGRWADEHQPGLGTGEIGIL